MTAEERLGLILAEMRQAGLDRLLAISGDMHPFQQLDPVFLLSGVSVIGDCLVVLDASGESTLVVSPAWEADRARERSRSTRTVGSDDMRASLARIARQRGKLGIAGLDTLSYATATWLASELGSGVRAFDAELRRAVRRKTAEEIGRAQRATEIAERGYDLMLRVARAGMSELDLATELCTAMTALGADDNFIMLSAAPHNRAVRPPSTHKLDPGDIILCEISPSFEGQFSQICRTAIVGHVPGGYREKYALLQDAIRNGMCAAVPAATVGDVVDAVNANLIAAGYGEFCVPPHMRARGHGLGFGSVDPGDLSAGSKVVLDRDMVFVIHPNQYMPETGYMMCGEPVVVEPGGARMLSSRMATLDAIGDAG